MPRVTVPLFSLIIGINDYKLLGSTYKLRSLKGAVSDAESFRDWTQWVGAPSDQTTLLINEAATHDAIIGALKALKSDPRIRRGDPIFIYFAGHGTEVKAPPNWESENSDMMIQAIISSDCNPADPEQPIYPITDRNIGALIGQIALEKGDNITVVFDCCHSGSGTRGVSNSDDDPDDLESTPRAVEFPEEVYALIERNNESSTVMSGERMKMGLNAMHSHVLFSACSSDEQAYEKVVRDSINGTGTKRGCFSTALLKVFFNHPLDKLLNRHVLEYMEPIDKQRPQCQGLHDNRVLFNAKIPLSCRAFKIQKSVEDGTSRYTLSAGYMQKINTRTGFAVFEQSDLDLAKQIGTLSVSNVHVMSSTATIDFIDDPDPHAALVAIRTSSGREGDLRISIPENNDFRGIYDTLKHEFPAELDNVSLVDGQEFDMKAELGSQGEITFTLHTRYPIQHPAIPMPWSTTVRYGLPSSGPSSEELVHILSCAANFYRELSLDDSSQRKMKVDFRFFELDIDDDQFYPMSDCNLFRDGVVVVTKTGKNIPYGIELVNNSQRSIYPYVFYLDNRDLSIQSLTQASSDVQHDAPLKGNGTFHIGWGAGGYGPFAIVKNEKTAIDYIKIYLANEPVNMQYMEQSSPFLSGRSMTTFQAITQKYAEMIIPIVQPA